MRRAQRWLYSDRCDIYATLRGVDPATGKPYGEQVQRVGVAMPCHYHFTPNIDDTTDVGRIKRDILDTTDNVRFPTGVNLSGDWWLVNVTPGSRLFGNVHRIVGAPQIIEGGPRYRVNTQIVLTTQEEKPPAALVELLPKTFADWQKATP
jgi:hypothetical protein